MNGSVHNMNSNPQATGVGNLQHQKIHLSSSYQTTEDKDNMQDKLEHIVYVLIGLRLTLILTHGSWAAGCWPLPYVLYQNSLSNLLMYTLWSFWRCQTYEPQPGII